MTVSRSASTRHDQRRLFSLLVVCASLLLGGIATEVTFRVLEGQEQARTTHEGTGGVWVPDERWGFKPAPGRFRVTTPEFDVHGTINDQFMNDRPWDSREAEGRQRILALGDSHTCAVGVSQEDTWVRQLEDC